MVTEKRTKNPPETIFSSGPCVIFHHFLENGLSWGVRFPDLTACPFGAVVH